MLGQEAPGVFKLGSNIVGCVLAMSPKQLDRLEEEA